MSPSISGDGRYVAFAAAASNLVAGDTNNHNDIFLRDLQAGTTRRISMHADGAQPWGQSYQPVFSTDGRFVAFYSSSPLAPEDLNRVPDAFVYELG
jgi:Tol biopolymer transport system component